MDADDTGGDHLAAVDGDVTIVSIDSRACTGGCELSLVVTFALAIDSDAAFAFNGNNGDGVGLCADSHRAVIGQDEMGISLERKPVGVIERTLGDVPRGLSDRAKRRLRAVEDIDNRTLRCLGVDKFLLGIVPIQVVHTGGILKCLYLAFVVFPVIGSLIDV